MDPFENVDRPQGNHGMNSGSPKNRNLGTVVFKPRGATMAFTSIINNDQSLTRTDKTVKYEGILQFIDAIERELNIDTESSLNELMGRVSIGRGSGGMSSFSDQDIIYEKDPLAGIKMEHSNVWL